MARLVRLTLAALLAALPGFAQSRGVCEVYAAQLTPLFSLFSEARGDNLTTTDPAWRGSRIGEVKGAPDYTYYREEGRILDARVALEGTVPLFLWWSPGRQDNFASTHPLWTNNTSPHPPDYQFVRVLGNVFSPDRPQPAGTVPVFSLYSDARGDSFLTSDPQWRASRNGYNFLRIEGYVCGLPPAQKLSYRSIPGHYIICNLLQMEATRHPVWSGVLTLYGATPAEVSQYGSYLSQAAECACRNDNAGLGVVVSKWRGLLNSIDARLGQVLRIDPREAGQLREAGIMGERDNFRNQCMAGAGSQPGQGAAADALLALSQLPGSPNLGLGPPASADAALGRCRGGSAGSAYTPINVRAGGNTGAGNPANFLSCLNGSYPLPFRQDCTNPAADETGDAGTASPPPAPAPEPKGGSGTKKGDEAKGGRTGGNSGSNPASSASTTVSGAGATAASNASVAIADAAAAAAAAAQAGNTDGQTPDSAAGAVTAVRNALGVSRFDFSNGTATVDFRAGVTVSVTAGSGGGVGFNSGGISVVVSGGQSRIGNVQQFVGGITVSGRFQCANVNPVSDPAMGLRRSASSINAGYMTNADRAMGCLCKNQNPALSGFASKTLESLGVEQGCSSLRFSERSDCMQPKGLKGQVMQPDPQCSEYARLDNLPKLSQEEFCKRVILCPNGLPTAVRSSAAGFTCGCGTATLQPRTGIGTQSPGGVRCELVSCTPGDTSACCSQGGIGGVSANPRTPTVPGAGTAQPGTPALPGNIPKPKQ